MTGSEPKLGPIAAALRDDLLGKANLSLAAQVANPIIQRALDEFNDAGTNVATSLVARALVARALIAVAAAWCSDITKAPEPETTAALRSIVTDPPAAVESVCWVDQSIARRG